MNEKQTNDEQMWRVMATANGIKNKNVLLCVLLLQWMHADKEGI
jgi:hypothetical protein